MNRDLQDQIKNHLKIDDIDDSEELLNLLRSKKDDSKSEYLLARLLYEFSMDTNELSYINESIDIFDKIKESDFDNVNYYLGTLYLVKYYALKEKPKFLIDNEMLLYNSKLYLKREISINSPQTFREANINLGIVYDVIGRTIDSIDCFDGLLKKFNSTYAFYNKWYSLYIYRTFSENPSLIIKDVYNGFKEVVGDTSFSFEMRQKSQQYIDEILAVYSKDFLESESNEEIKIFYETDFEGFMINYCMENKLYLNLCNFCQRCNNSLGDKLVIEKVIREFADKVEKDLFLVLSSYLNQMKMDYVSARFLLMLYQYEGFDLDIITNYIYITDIQFAEENNIRVQLLKDSFKNFFNIFDKIAYFLNHYLKLGISLDYVSFQNVWFKNGKWNQGINKKLLKMDNVGLTALYDIYLELKKDNEKFYLRDTRNKLTHKYLRITNKKQNENDKTVEELCSETIEIAILAKNAIFYLMRLIKIHEEQKREDSGIDFVTKFKDS